jgi:hypothetical protein
VIGKLTPARADSIPRAAIMKKEIPFEKIDYEMAMNVKKNCRIYEERDLLLRKAIED